MRFNLLRTTTLVVLAAAALSACESTASRFQVDGQMAGTERIDMDTYTIDEAPFRSNIGNFPIVLYKRVFETEGTGNTTFCLAQIFDAPTVIETGYAAFKPNGYLATRTTVIAPLTAIPTTTDSDVQRGSAKAACFETTLRYSSTRKSAALFPVGTKVRVRD